MSKVNFTQELSMLLAKPVWSREDREDVNLYLDKPAITQVESALQAVARNRLLNEEYILG